MDRASSVSIGRGHETYRLLISLLLVSASSFFLPVRPHVGNAAFPAISDAIVLRHSDVTGCEKPRVGRSRNFGDKATKQKNNKDYKTMAVVSFRRSLEIEVRHSFVGQRDLPLGK